MAKRSKSENVSRDLEGAVLTADSLRQVLKNSYSDKAEIDRMFKGFTLDVMFDESEGD